MQKHVLVRQCLIPACDGALHVGVRPQRLQRLGERDGEGLAVSDVPVAIYECDMLDIFGQDFELEIFHGVEDVSQAPGEVFEHQLSEGLDLVRLERNFVDEAHLLQYTIDIKSQSSASSQWFPRTEQAGKTHLQHCRFP